MPSGGLLALLDDVSMMTRQVAASVDDVSTIASMTGKGIQGAAAVTVDDIPVSAEALTSEKIDPKRELPIIKRIYKNALKTRLVVTPVTSLVSHFAPAAMPVILGVGGAYLAYEGAEKVLHGLGHGDEDHEGDTHATGKVKLTPQQKEDTLVKGATVTDGVMATEISFMAMDQIEKLYSESSPVSKSAALFGVNTAVATLIYSLVGGLVRMDDWGLKMMSKQGEGAVSNAIRSCGRGLISAAPKISGFLSRVGTGAMLWIGGELVTPGVSAVAKYSGMTGLHHGAEAVIHGIHHLSQMAQSALPQAVSFLSGFTGWAVDAVAYQGVGLAAGLGLIGGVKLASAAVDYVRDLKQSRTKDVHTSAPVAASKIDAVYAPAMVLTSSVRGPGIEVPHKLTEIAKAVIGMGQTPTGLLPVTASAMYVAPQMKPVVA